MENDNSVTPLPPRVALHELPAGRSARITEIHGDRALARKLLSLGLRVGSEISVVQQRNKGVVVACAGNRVALGGNVADKMITQPLDAG
ncbi:MAG TPA: ferrous iron transport protein A [Sedimenticola sp.]|nr:ferrous iron transport protein A [Sedimenticola sp.]